MSSLGPVGTGSLRKGVYMVRRKSEGPSPLGRAELELLQYLDRHPDSSVGDAAAQFGVPRGLARTTILTMMQRLVTKGFLKRKQVDSVYRYSTQVSASRAISEMVSDFIRGVLGGSVSPFVAYLSEAKDLSDDDVQELRKLVQGLEQRPARTKSKSKPKAESGED